jgi:hypothetical protein
MPTIGHLIGDPVVARLPLTGRSMVRPFVEEQKLKPVTAERVYWILMTLSVAVTGSYLIWSSQRPSEEEVQRRMQEGLEAHERLEEVRKMEEKFKADQERAFGTRAATDR